MKTNLLTNTISKVRAILAGAPSTITKSEAIDLQRTYLDGLGNVMSLQMVERNRMLFTGLKSASIPSFTVVFDDKLKANVAEADIVRLKESPITNAIMGSLKSKKVLIMEELKTVDDYSDEYMQVTLTEDIAKLLAGHKSIYYCPHLGILYIKSIKARHVNRNMRRKNISVPMDEGKYINVINGNITENLPMGTVEYDLRYGIVSSNSIKHISFYAPKKDPITSYSSYMNYLRAKVGTSFKSTKEIFESAGSVARFFTRPGIALTGQRTVAMAKSVAIIEKLDLADGFAYLNYMLVQEAFHLESKEDAIGLQIQGRTSEDILSKVQFKSTSSIGVILRKYKRDGKPFKIYTVDGSPVDLDKIDMIIDLNGVKIIGLDLNNPKIIGQLEKPIPVNLLAIARLTEGKLSKQIGESLEVFGAKAKQLDKVKSFYIEQYKRMLAEELSRLVNAKEKAPSLSCNYSIEMLKAVAPTAPLSFNVQREQMYNKVAETVHKLAITIKDAKNRNCVWNMVATPDLGVYFGTRIIPDGFIVLGKFSKELARLEMEYGKGSKQYKSYYSYCKSAYIFKNPKMKPDEFYNARVLSITDVCEMIDKNNDLNEEEKMSLKYEYKHINDAAIILPANKEVIDNLADMDFDFDKNVVVFASNHEVWSLLDNKYSLDIIDTKSSRTKDGNKDNELSKLYGNIKKETDNGVYLSSKDEQFFISTFLYTTSKQGNIGMITNWNNAVVGILVELLRGNAVPATHLLAELFRNGKEGSKETYVKPTGKISMDYVDAMFDEMAECKWTNENIEKFLWDCIRVFRLYQGGTIDSAKTGLYLTIRLMCKTVKCKSLLNVSALHEDNTSKIVRKDYVQKEITIEYEDGENIKFNTFLMNDFMGEIQDELIKITNEEFSIELEKHEKNCRWQEAELSEMALKFIEIRKSNPKALEELRILNSLYIDAVSTLIKAKENVMKTVKDTKERDKKSDIIDEQYDEKIATITLAANRVMNKLDLLDSYDKGALAFAISMWKRSKENGKYIEGINPNSRSRFAITIFPKEAHNYIIGCDDDVVICEAGIELNLANHQIGDKVFVAKGLSQDGLLIDENYTGVVTIGEDNSVYVEKSFEDFKIKTTTNDNKSRVLVIDKESIDKNVEKLMDKVSDTSLFTKEKSKIYFSKDDNSEFELCSKDKENIMICDAVDGEQYFVRSIYTCSIYCSKGKVSSYVIELNEEQE